MTIAALPVAPPDRPHSDLLPFLLDCFAAYTQETNLWNSFWDARELVVKPGVVPREPMSFAQWEKYQLVSLKCYLGMLS